jgi:hypothetical protein
VLSVLLRFTDLDYPFGIFKLSLTPCEEFACYMYIMARTSYIEMMLVIVSAVYYVTGRLLYL